MSVHTKSVLVNLTDMSVFVFVIKFCFNTSFFEPVTDAAGQPNVKEFVPMQEVNVPIMGQRIGYFE